MLPPLVWLAVYRWNVRGGRGGAEAGLRACGQFLLFIWVLSNLLGAFGALRVEPLRIIWLALAAGAGVYLVRTRRSRAVWPRPSGAVEWALVAVAGMLLTLTLVRAIAYPPNTVDVLNYHLPRQVMWLQQGGIDPFDTINDRQNMMPPLAELTGLQFLALTGDDRWSALPQWFAYLGLWLGSAVLARRLGASRPGALLAGALGLLIPMAYQEASVAKNDLFVTFLLVLVALRLVAWTSGAARARRRDAVELGVLVALACLTKSTALIYAPLLCAAGLLKWAWQERWSPALKPIAIAALTWAVLMTPFFVRNQAWYGSPLGEHRAEEGGALLNQGFSPGLVVSNVLREATLHVLIPIAGWNEAWLAAVRRAHTALNVNIDDPRTTLWITKFDPHYAPTAEMIAGAPAHFLLGLPLLCWLVLARRRDGAPPVRWLAAFALVGGLAFCVALKWQPWATRLQLPLFALGAAAAVAGGEALIARKRGWLGGAALASALAAWFPGADHDLRPLWTGATFWTVPRESGYYGARPLSAARDAAFVHLAQRAGVRTVYLHNVHDMAYPLMRSLRAAVPGIVFAGAPAGRLAAEPPEAVLVLAWGAPCALYRDFFGRSDWRLVGGSEGDGFYLRRDRVIAAGLGDALPAFGGWDWASGFSTLDQVEVDHRRLDFRHLTQTTAQILCPGRATPLRLRLGGVNIAPSRQNLELEIRVEGQPVARWSMTPGWEEKLFTVELPVSDRPRMLEVVALDRTAQIWARFTRIQIFDLLPEAAAAP
ncbi:MAG: hypothetical protein HYV96_19910 [Opitutae bacterium]|nr:hypothetical protein [Opitutae bacterium]